MPSAQLNSDALAVHSGMNDSIRPIANRRGEASRGPKYSHVRVHISWTSAKVGDYSQGPETLRWFLVPDAERSNADQAASV